MAILDAALISALDQMQVDDGLSPIPAGDYTLQVTDADTKKTRDLTGQYIKCEFSVVAPSHQGRKVFTNFNIFNRNPEAERIGRSQFKAFYTAAGFSSSPRDTDELIGRTVLAHVTIEQDKSGRYSDQNRLSKFRPATEAPAAAPAPAPSVPSSGGSFAAAFGGTFAAPSSEPTVPDFASAADAPDFSSPSSGFVFK